MRYTLDDNDTYTDITVIRCKRRTVALQIKHDGVYVRAPLHYSDADICAFLDEHRAWLIKHLEKKATRDEKLQTLPPFTDEEKAEFVRRAKILLAGRVAYYASKMGVEYGRVTVRLQKSRYGSCSGKGNLNFNAILVLLPPLVADSIVVHELCHILHMNHSKAFYDEVKRHFPEYDACDKWLKENGAYYLARI